MALFSNISNQMMISLTSIVSRSKTKWYKYKRIIGFKSKTSDDDDQMLILCVSYFITTAIKKWL